MQANLQQKAQVLQALLGYAQGQLNGASTSVTDAVTDNDDELGGTTGHMSDAADVLDIARAFADTGDVDAMCSEIRLLDTLVREDVWEGMREMEDRELLEALSERIGYAV